MERKDHKGPIESEAHKDRKIRRVIRDRIDQLSHKEEMSDEDELFGVMIEIEEPGRKQE